MVFRSRLLIGKLPMPAISGDRRQLTDSVHCPTSSLEPDKKSRKGWKRRDGEGIGLGIVAALEKPCGKNSPKVIVGAAEHRVVVPQRHSLCKEYCDQVCSTSARDNCGGVGKGATGVRASSGSPPSIMMVGEEFEDFKVADFLSHCYLCRQNLHGKDIYMYRGDKAFCSMECRYKQIVNDEYQEKFGVEVLKSPEISRSPISEQLFFTGIVVS